MMEYQIKKAIVDGLLKVVDNSPILTKSQNVFDDKKEEYEIWLKYVFSTLDIVGEYVSYSFLIMARNEIKHIDTNKTTYFEKINSICKILLNLAEQILSM